MGMAQESLIIDGQVVSCRADDTILTAARRAGIDIPSLCYYEGLDPWGACRLCLVEIEGRPGYPTACTTRAQPGTVVWTESPPVVERRKALLELLLSDHPSDCLLCEADGNCRLQALAYRYQVRSERWKGERHPLFVVPGSSRPQASPVSPQAIADDNPLIRRDYDKCVLCGLCVRVCAQVRGVGALAFAGRGFSTHIAAGLGEALDPSFCEFCGQCVEVCPTGALVDRKRVGLGRAYDVQRVLTTCPYCAVGCQLYLEVRQGRLVGVRPHYDNPVNAGHLCIKGRYAYDFVHHPDRLTTPLLRQGEKFVEASWQEAVTLVAERLAAIKRQYGPEAIAVTASCRATNEPNYLLQKFARAVLGTNNVDNCARLCHAPTVAGLRMVVGAGAMTNSIAEIEDADLLMVTGSNTTEAHPVLALRIKRAVAKGARLIVIDPRRTKLARLAHRHLQLRVGTDIPLLNAMMHVIIAEGLYDPDYLTRSTVGFAALQEAVAEYTPQRVAEICGVPAQDIVATAREYATTERAAIIYSLGITEHSTGTLNVVSLGNLALLTGHFGRESAGVNPLRGQNNVQGVCDMGALPNVLPGYQALDDPEVRAKFERAWGCRLPTSKGLMETEYADALLAGRLRAWYIVGENPALSYSHVGQVREALQAAEFLVVQDLFLTETAQYADVVLPAAAWAETEGTYTNSERRVQRVRQAIPPPGQAKQDWEIVCALAQAMGYPMHYASPAEIWDEIASLTPSLAGISYERLERERVGLQWPCPTPDHPGTKFLHADLLAGKRRGTFVPVVWEPYGEQPDEEYPFVLTTGRRLFHYHTRTMTGRAGGLDQVWGRETVDLNPADAQRLKVSNGDLVRVVSRRGAVLVAARLTDECPPGTVFMAFHFPDVPTNLMTEGVYDSVTRTPRYKACAVRLEPVRTGQEQS
jgi:formate dehydrogenase alpha subunit